MVLIGMPVKIKVIRKRGEIYKPKVSYKTGIVVARYPKFVVVKFPEGYTECFRESELII